MTDPDAVAWYVYPQKTGPYTQAEAYMRAGEAEAEPPHFYTWVADADGVLS